MSEKTKGTVNKVPADMSTMSFLRLFSFSSFLFGDFESSVETIIHMIIVTIPKMPVNVVFIMITSILVFPNFTIVIR